MSDHAPQPSLAPEVHLRKASGQGPGEWFEIAASRALARTRAVASGSGSTRSPRLLLGAVLRGGTPLFYAGDRLAATPLGRTGSPDDIAAARSSSPPSAPAG